VAAPAGAAPVAQSPVAHLQATVDRIEAEVADLKRQFE
jgi:hypothetical protein